VSVFKDVMGRQWIVELDGLVMARVRDEAKIDLADLSGNGYLRVETDTPSLVAALQVICRQQIKDKGLDAETFARGIKKDALTESAAAVVDAAADFFPTKIWSAVLSRLETSRQMKSQTMSMSPLLTILDDPGMPERMKDAVMDAIGELIRTAGANTALGPSTEKPSAGGPAATLFTPASDSLESAESIHAA
jgi:hypothetical protein